MTDLAQLHLSPASDLDAWFDIQYDVGGSTRLSLSQHSAHSLAARDSGQQDFEQTDVEEEELVFFPRAVDLFSDSILSTSASPAAVSAAPAPPLPTRASGGGGHQAKHWCFTINNPSADQLAHVGSLPETLPEDVQFVVVGQEVGETGTPHLQGYVELFVKRRLKWVKDNIDQTAHFEVRRGPREAARDYCCKDGLWYETGEWHKEERGRRRDIEMMVEAATSGETFYDACCAEATVAQFPHAFTKLGEGYALSQTPAWRDVTVVVKIGPTGCGKTRSVYTLWPDLFTQDCSVGGEIWWDGYSGQTNLLMDDFAGGIGFRWMLRLLDGYPIRLRIKGAHTYGRWTTVYVTSNMSIDDWYTREPDISPLLRRISRIEHYRSDGTIRISSPPFIM